MALAWYFSRILFHIHVFLIERQRYIRYGHLFQECANDQIHIHAHTNINTRLGHVVTPHEDTKNTCHAQWAISLNHQPSSNDYSRFSSTISRIVSQTPIWDTHGLRRNMIYCLRHVINSFPRNNVSIIDSWFIEVIFSSLMKEDWWNRVTQKFILYVGMKGERVMSGETQDGSLFLLWVRECCIGLSLS